MDLWTELKKLQGGTLRTLGKDKLFDVIVVLSDSIIVKPHFKGKERSVPRTAFEGVWRELTSNGEITRVRIEAEYMPRSSAYIAAMLLELPGVSYENKPVIRLFYKKGE